MSASKSIAAPASRRPLRRPKTAGFTLIELSIVLVIIGLIVGGVLVGQDLIKAAQIRATISQIEKYNTAVNTFYVKFSALPGDMLASQALAMGFAAGAGCTGAQGARDGNGLIDGGTVAAGLYSQGGGETALFWQDLSTAGLIDFTLSGMNCNGCPAVAVANLGQYFPSAKAGNNSYVYEYAGSNWFGVSGLNAIQTCGNLNGPAGSIPVIQAYNIDKKIDDSLPMTGNVQASIAINQTLVTWAYMTDGNNNPLQCFDGNPINFPNGGAYSTGPASGNYSDLPNCSLSFVMQGAAR